MLRILHLEDNPVDAKMVLGLLRKSGMAAESDRVATMEDFQAAMERESYALILSDYTLPGMDPLEALRLARQTHPEVPFVFVSGTLGEDRAIETLKLGASDYVLKQKLQRLVPAVQRALQEHEALARRKQAEQARRDSEQRLAGIIESAMDAIVSIDEQQRIVVFNPAAEKMFRCSAGAALGRSIDRFIPERLREVHRQHVRNYARTGDTSRAMGHLRPLSALRADGEEFPIEASISQVSVGGAKLFTVILRDITERRRAEQAIRESEERFRTLADNIAQLAWMADEKGWIFWYNQRWYDYTGTTLEQMQGWDWQKVHHPEHMQRVVDKFRHHVEAGAVWEDTFPLRGKDGQYRWFLSRAIPIRNTQGKVVRWFGTNTDVTELRDVHEALTVANAAKDRFLAILSHELRTPLTPVLALVAMLQGDSRFDAETRENLQIIRRNVETEAQLIDDLLDMTSIAREKIELKQQPVRVCEVIQRAIEVCRPDIDARQLHLGVDFGECQSYLTKADKGRLQQVFWNLLKNAVKFTPHGGHIGVRCHVEGDKLITEVSDSGIGIEPEAMGRIFQAFEQAEKSITRQYGGLGLGLAITKSLVEMHGGSIQAHSEGKDRGATFRVSLPILADATSAGVDRPEAPPVSEAVPRGVRILLVEDHGDTARIMRRLLMSDGHQVQTAGDVATALELTGREPFDLLISDLGLPDGSGLDLLRELRAQGYRMPAIALSGFGQEEDIRRSEEAGFAVHLTKPTSPDRLAEAIAATLGQATASPSP